MSSPCSRRLVAAVAALAAGAALPPGALAQGPVAPPGPPPGNGGDLPAPPGTAPAYVPPGSPGAIPAEATGPGLLGDRPVRLNRARRTIAVPIACQRGGTVRVTAAAVSKAPLAHASFRCAAHRAVARLRVSPTTARRIARRPTVAATLSVAQGGAKATKLYVELRVGGAKPSATRGFWTDGHLQCADGSGTPQAYLVEPDFTTASPTPVSTRGWIAWYTADSGWHWLGTGGEGAGRWDTWTATVSGIAQFHPGGATAPVPWTQGPIAIPAGRGVIAVGVYEIVYWVGGRPDHQWHYVNAGTTGAAAAGGGEPFCRY